MRKIFLVLLLLTGLSSCDSKTIDKSTGVIQGLEEDNNYPQWLTVSSDQAKSNDLAKQTSGISFIGRDSRGNKNFLIADDIGKIHRLVITNDTISQILPVFFSQQVKDYFSVFPKLDFEEITYDKYTGDVYLSIEGNSVSFLDYTGIFRLNFAGKNVFSDTVLTVEKLLITPESLFYKYIDNNVGYEGLASDKNYIYLGLEGFAEKGLFNDSTIIFIVDKSSLKIIKEISTKKFGIQSICGLHSNQDNSLYGVDRNNKRIFHISLGESLDIVETKTIPVRSYIPGYHSLTYIAALESITMDDEKNLYFVDDPWTKYFVPSEEVLEKLDDATVNNFKSFVPVIFKFINKN